MSRGRWKTKTIWPCPHCESSYHKRVKLRDHLIEAHEIPERQAEIMVGAAKKEKRAKADWL